MAKNTTRKNQLKRPVVPSQKLKKDPGIPKFNLSQHGRLANLARKQEAQMARSLQAKSAPRGDDIAADQSSMATLAELAASSARDSLDNKETDAAWRLKYADGPGDQSDPTMSAHAYQFRKILELADVVLEVLDARDPLGCRSKLLEEEVIRSGGEKKLLLVLNKTDLVPKENVLAWLRYLRHSFPTIPFKSSTQHQRSNLSSSSGTKSGSKGSSHLLHILKSIRPAHQSITVGVLGAPNVGKSSLINSIKREKVCTVGAKPGETRALKEVAVERGIKVVDSPGIVWGDAMEGGAMWNVWSLEGLEDPVMVAEGIVGRVPPEILQSMYNTPPFKDAMELLTMISLVRGKLGKGGKPDIMSAALSVVHDWNIGKIPFFTVPPEVHPSMASAPAQRAPADAEAMEGTEDEEAAKRAADFGSTTIVQSWSKPFDLEGLWDALDADVLDDNDEEMQEGEDDGSFIPDKVDEDISPDANAQEYNSIETLSRPQSRLASGIKAGNQAEQAKRPAARERKPPKLPRERTQRLAAPELDLEGSDLLMSSMNPLGRKNLKVEAKRRRKLEAALEAGEDIEM